jgi:hypothetical protein
MELTARLGNLQAEEEQQIERFTASPKVFPPAAMSECMTRLILIGELLDWAGAALDAPLSELPTGTILHAQGL